MFIFLVYSTFVLTDGGLLAATFNASYALSIDSQNNIYVADSAIRYISYADKTVSTLAGVSSGHADGSGATSKFNSPSGVYATADGSMVYVADTNNNAVRQIGCVSGMFPVSCLSIDS